MYRIRGIVGLLVASLVLFAGAGAVAATTTYTKQFDCAKLGAGKHTLTVTATDVYGNTGTSTRTFFCAAAPSTVPVPMSGTITSPATASTVSGVVPVVVTTSGPVDHVLVQYWSNATGSVRLPIMKTPPWSEPWATAALPAGSYILSAVLFDRAGASVDIKRVSVKVVTPPPPPATAPASVTVPSRFKAVCVVRKVVDKAGHKHIVTNCRRLP